MKVAARHAGYNSKLETNMATRSNTRLLVPIWLELQSAIRACNYFDNS